MTFMAGKHIHKGNIAWQAAIVLIICGAINFLYLTDALQRLEWISLDQRMRLYRAEQEVPENIVTIMIDEESLRDMAPEFGRFPWPRGVYGDLIDFLAMGGAKAVLFDILFTEKEQSAPGELTQDDTLLVEAGAATGIAYHSAQIIADREDEAGGSRLNRPMPADFSERFSIAGSGFRRRVHNNFFLPFAGLYQSAAGIGVVGVDPDPDGIFRHIHPFREYHGRLYPALAIAPLIQEIKPKPQAIFTPGKISIGPLDIPVNDQEEYLINPYGRMQQYSISGVFASLKMIMAGEVENLLVNPAEFSEKTVLVGASAVGLEDIKATPMSAKTPGVLLQAWALANIQEGDFLRRADRKITMGFVALFTLITMISVFYCSGFILRAGLPLFLSCGYCYLGFSSFANNFIYDLAPPLLAIIATILCCFTFLSFTEGREKRAVRKIFSRYVSPEILSELLDQPDQFSLGEIGRKENMTILFSDIRGFTSISENLDAGRVVDLLNCHFAHMTEVIFAHKGTLDKFIGDALMAFWGAPLKVDNHELHAVSAALAMVARLDTVNSELTSRGYPAIDIGIGINSGEVILGNIGSEKKMDYTVIGDHVNLASRLEGLTKKYGFPVIISEYTREKLPQNFPCLVVDQVRVKGKNKPIGIYAPLAENNPRISSKQSEIASEAFHAYQTREWHKAAELYKALSCGKLAKIYGERCVFFRENPPPDDWDGVFTLETK